MVDNRVHYAARLKSHYFSHPDEIKSLAYMILVAAFILSFDKWGGETFSAAEGIANFLAAILICGIGIILHDAAHRAAAIKLGFEIEHKVWFAGMIASIGLVMATRGFLKTYLFESMIFSPVRLHRMGRYPYFGTTWEYCLFYIAGPATSLLLAGGLAAAAKMAGISGGIIGLAIQFNLVYGLLALLPLPPLDGMWILIYSRGVYAGAFIGALGYMLMTLAGLTGLTPILTAVTIGILSGIYWMMKLD